MSAPQFSTDESIALLRACAHRSAFLGLILWPQMERRAEFTDRDEAKLLQSAAVQISRSLESEA